jgi:hypothetical protein
MAIAFVASEEQHGVDGATTAAIDTTGATLLVAVVSDFTGGPGITFSDSKSNTWTSLTAYTNTAGQMRVRIYYAYATSGKVGSGHTFTSAGTGVYTCACVAAFSGTDTGADPYNADVTGINDFGPVATPMSTGSLTVDAGHLSITGAGIPFGAGTTVMTMDDGAYTIAEYFHTSGVTEGAGIAYWINSGGSTSKNPGWDPDISMGAAGTHATFEPSAGGGGSTPSPAVGALSLTGTTGSLGFTILMPDEV